MGANDLTLPLSLGDSLSDLVGVVSLTFRTGDSSFFTFTFFFSVSDAFLALLQSSFPDALGLEVSDFCFPLSVDLTSSLGALRVGLRDKGSGALDEDAMGGGTLPICVVTL